MDWFRNLKIRTQLLLGFALVIALVMAQVFFAVKQIMDIGYRHNIVIRHPVALRTALLEFQADYANLRRQCYAMALGAATGGAENEELSAAAAATHATALAHLDNAKSIVTANPELTRDEKNARVANNDQLRGLFNRYHAEVAQPLMRAALSVNDLSSVTGPAADIAVEVRVKLEEMLASANATADAQIGRAEGEADRVIAMLFATSVAAALMAVAVSLYFANHIGKPLTPLAVFMKKAATAGDFSLTDEDLRIIRKYGGNQDEPGQVIGAASTFVWRVLEMGRALEAVSGGNLTRGVRLLSERDSMGRAFRQMLDNLNAMCGDINAASMRVATGANQFTAAAQTLSSGATEQAAVIEELSCAIAEMDERTREAARMAGQAAGLARSVRDNAEKGNRQMEGMLEAVNGISEASQAIRKIIKMINDIAFQTGILAVNAAVEAAHAGRYGSGFSVVAAEVKNLATKSAEAAKITERLIANTIEKTGQGVAIAGETSASLAAIIAGVGENSAIVTEIARSSEMQSASISQINQGITQVAQVVQQNSGTAEESAAAAEQMAAQAAMLRQLTAQFRLRESRRSSAAPSAANERRELTEPARQPSLPAPPAGKEEEARLFADF